MKKKWMVISLRALLSAIIAVSAAYFYTSSQKTTEVLLKEINIRFPTKVVMPLDPRKIYSVGDQLISEHIFAYHLRESVSSTYKNFFSDVSVDRNRNKIKVNQIFKIRNQDGSQIGIEEQCVILSNALKGTSHQEYLQFFRGLTCEKASMELVFEKIPINIMRVFSLPDFAVYDLESIPIDSKSELVNKKFPGPYYPTYLSQDNVILKRNKFFPDSLRANSVETVNFKTYKKSHLHEELESMNPSLDHLIYATAATIKPKDIEGLKNKGYQIKITPNEGLIYVQFGHKLNLDERTTIGMTIDAVRADLLAKTNYLMEGYSFAPADRPNGLKREDYFANMPNQKSKDLLNNKEIIFGYFKNSSTNEFAKSIYSSLRGKFPNMIFKEYDFEQVKKFDEEVDLSIEQVGLSSADPVPHLFYQMKINFALQKILSRQELNVLAAEENEQEFFKKAKEIELKLLKERAFVPLAHTSGIVAVSPLLEEDENLKWSWGTAAWTYRVRSNP